MNFEPLSLAKILVVVYQYLIKGVRNVGHGASAPSAGVLLASESFGFDALTGFGKDSAVTGFAVFKIDFDNVEI
ncbi:MAG: hypothetical protein ACU837_13260 [Gammaproteobacteria bacterium]